MAYVPTRKQIRAIQPELPPGKRAKALFQTVLNLVQRVVKHKAEAIYKCRCICAPAARSQRCRAGPWLKPCSEIRGSKRITQEIKAGIFLLESPVIREKKGWSPPSHFPGFNLPHKPVAPESVFQRRGKACPHPRASPALTSKERAAGEFGSCHWHIPRIPTHCCAATQTLSAAQIPVLTRYSRKNAVSAR